MTSDQSNLDRQIVTLIATIEAFAAQAPQLAEGASGLQLERLGDAYLRVALAHYSQGAGAELAKAKARRAVAAWRGQ